MSNMVDKKLSEKYKIEKQFHDDWAHSIDLNDVYVTESFEAVSALENRAVMHYFGDVKGKRVLDLGCGAGEAAVYFALKGAEVVAVDLSDEMLKKACALAGRHDVTIQTVVSPVETLDFPENYFDFIYGSSILHHADLHLTLKESARILKKDGKAAFIEPLSYNPIINIYRKIAEDVRTPTETCFNLRDFKFMHDYFEEIDFEFCWLTTLNVFLYMYFIERINPSQDRYWKRIVREHKRYEKMFQRFNRFDQLLMKVFPFLKYMTWTTVIKLSEKK